MKKEIQLNGGDAHNEEPLGYDLQRNGEGSTELVTNSSTWRRTSLISRDLSNSLKCWHNK